MDDRTVRCLTLPRRHVPLLRRSANQHGAGLRARLTQLAPRLTHTGTAGGHLRSGQPVDIFRRSRCKISDHLRGIDIQLLGHQRGQRGRDPLPHFRMVDDNHDRALVSDPHPRIGAEDHLADLGPRGSKRQRVATSARVSRGLMDGSAHPRIGSTPAKDAAQRAIDIVVSGRTIAGQQALAARIIAGWQKPHCGTCWASQA